MIFIVQVIQSTSQFRELLLSVFYGVLSVDDAKKAHINELFEDLINKNQFLRIPIHQHMLSVVFGCEGKSFRSKLLFMDVRIYRDKNNVVVLRGSLDDVSNVIMILLITVCLSINVF